MRNTENCDRCLPDVYAKAIGYIPLPEMSSEEDSRYDERRILLCNFHYFEAKKDCFYVVPLDRDDDPVDSFLTRVNDKHKRIRGSLRLKFRTSINGNESISVEEVSPTRTAKKLKVHLREEDATLCGLPLTSAVNSEDDSLITCRNCITLNTLRKLEKELLRSYA